MMIYIPQNVDIYNTHTKNLINSYINNNVQVIAGYETFVYGCINSSVIHFHMLYGLLNYLKNDEEKFFSKMEYFKKKGTKFIYTAHDLMPPNINNAIEYCNFFTKAMNYIDLIINHGENSIQLLNEKFPITKNMNHIVCHHGDYLEDMGMYNDKKEEARKILSFPINKKIILIFGRLHNKNTDFAKEVIRTVRKNQKDLILVMAGIKPVFKKNMINQIFYKFNNKYMNYFFRNSKELLGRFDNYYTYLLFKAADIIFLPHDTGLTTGIIPMAATLKKAFVYPDIGVFSEQAENCISRKYIKNNHYEASRAIIDLLKEEQLEYDNTLWLKNNNWDSHVKKILENIL